MLSDLSLLGFGLFITVVGSLVFYLLNTASIDPVGAPFYRAVLLIGLVTMALLQTIKRLTTVRRSFHEEWVKSWLSRPSSNGINSFNTLKRLAVASSSSVFLELPIEQVCGQITAAAEALLEYPADQTTKDSPILSDDNERKQLITALAGEAGQEDALRYDQACSALIEHKDAKDKKPEQTYLAARNRLSQRFQRNIDALQIEVGLAWRRRMWISALFTGIVLAFVASNQLHDWKSRVFFVITAGLTGGFLATVARDLIAVVERLRR